MGCKRSDAYLNIYVHSFCRSSREITFPDKILQEVCGGKCQLKTFKFFSNKLSLDLEISTYFSSLSTSFKRATAR